MKLKNRLVSMALAGVMFASCFAGSSVPVLADELSSDEIIQEAEAAVDVSDEVTEDATEEITNDALGSTETNYGDPYIAGGGDITMSDTAVNILIGESQNVGILELPSGVTSDQIQWHIFDSTVASLEATTGGAYKVTGLSEGTTVVRAYTGTDPGSLNPTEPEPEHFGDIEIGIYPPVDSVSIVDSSKVVKTELTLEVGDEFSLEAKVLPDSTLNKTVSWASLQPEYASVVNGKITALAAGDATIKVTTESGGKTATCLVHVVPQTVTVPLTVGTSVDGSFDSFAENTPIYSFTIDNTSIYNLNMTYTGAGNMAYAIYDTSNTAIYSSNSVSGIGGASYSTNIALLKGNYRIKLTRSGTTGAGETFGLGLAVVSLSNNFQSFEETYGATTGRNDTRATASTITEGNVYHGIIASKGNIDDWYTINVGTNGATVKIKGDNFESTTPYVGKYVYVGDSETRRTDIETTIGTSYTEFTLVPGRHYINVSCFGGAAAACSFTYTMSVEENTPASQYTVTYAGGGGTATSDITQTVDAGSTITLANNYYTYAGHSFAGWMCDVESGAVYLPGASYTVNSNVTFTAKWTENPSTRCTVTYAGGGGTATTDVVLSVAPGTSITLVDNYYAKPGYLFTGWQSNTTPATVYQPGASYTVNADVTFTAVWKIDPSPVPPVDMHFPQEVYVMREGTSQTLQLIFDPINASPAGIIFKTSDREVATIDSVTGYVTAITPGNAYITAMTPDKSIMAACQIHVIDSYIKTEGVSLWTNSVVMIEGDTSVASCTVYPLDAMNKKVKYSTTNKKLIDIDENTGVFTAKAAGKAMIYVTTEEGGFTDSCSVNVLIKGTTIVPVTGVKFHNDPVKVNINENRQLAVDILPYNATDWGVTYESMNPDIAKVSSKGIVTGVSSGTTYVTATTNDGGFTATCRINVTTKDVNIRKIDSMTINKTSAVITPHGSLSLTVTFEPRSATYRDVIWVSSDETVATVSDTGFVQGVGEGVASIIAYALDGEHWIGCKVTVADNTVKHYDITYKLGIASVQSNLNNPDVYAKGTSVILYPAEQDGLIFKGWYTDSKFENSVTRINVTDTGNKTFYAKWSKQTYKITYDPNGGTNVANKYSYDVTTKTFKLKLPKKMYYKCDGWYDENDDLVTEIKKGSTGNKVLTAHWSPMEYPIVYKLGGGELINAQSFYYATEDFVLPTPIRNGAVFDGWKMGSRRVTTIPAHSSGKKTVTAIWDPIDYYITYDSDGGSEVRNKEEYNINTKTFKLKLPKRKGYKCEGWFNEDGEKVTSVVKGSYGDMHLTAVWTPVEYKIRYNLGGGTLYDAVDVYTIEDTVMLPIPDRDGYDFEGWVYKGEYWDMILPGTTGNITFKAKWSRSY